MSKNRFYMYTEYIHFLEGMEPEDQALLFRVILQHEGCLEIEEMTPAVKAVFSMIKNRLDNNREEYEKACEIHRECGKKGGRPKTKTNQNNQNKPNETKTNQTKPDNENDNENENDKEIKNPPAPLTEIVERWNRLSDVGVKPIERLTDKRKEQLGARVREYTADKILEAIERIRGSDFLVGKNGKGWMITFDWFIKPGNFPKVLEGNYDNKGVKTNGNGAIEGWGQDYDPYREYRTAGNDPGGGTVFD